MKFKIKSLKNYSVITAFSTFLKTFFLVFGSCCPIFFIQLSIEPFFASNRKVTVQNFLLKYLKKIAIFIVFESDENFFRKFLKVGNRRNVCNDLAQKFDQKKSIR